MLEMLHVMNGVTTMACNCPSDGNVTVDFSFLLSKGLR